MILKLLGPVLAVIGAVAAAIGAAALATRPVADVSPEGRLDAPVVVIPPEVLALGGLQGITVHASGAFDVRTARPVDAYAWAAAVDIQVVRGLSTWEEIEVDRAGSPTGPIPEFSGDLWREWDAFGGTATIDPLHVEPGVVVLVVAEEDSRLETVVFDMIRDRGNGWAWPVVAGGLGAMVVGFGAVLVRRAIVWFRDRREAA